MLRYWFAACVLFTAVLVAAAATAGEKELTGFVALEGRYFLNSAAFPGQENNTAPSLLAEPEWYYVSDDEKDTFTFKPFARWDVNDPERTHADLRQADWLHAEDDWSFTLGFSKVFWGVTESQHLVDIINQSDAIEDVDGEDKLGQPMAQFTYLTDYGNVSLLYMPYFRERTFPGRDGRLRPPLPIDTDTAMYADGAEEWHPDVAVRYKLITGNYDIGLSHFHGTARDPVLRAQLDSNGLPVLVPFYDVIDQTGLDVQYTTPSWLWKLEAIHRAGQGGRFWAMAGGFEYTFYDIDGENTDLGVLLEYHRDLRDKNPSFAAGGASAVATAPFTLFDNDVFAGGRLLLNDVDDTELLAGMIIDTNTRERVFQVEASTRYGDNWKVELDLRLYSGIEPTDPLFAFRQDDHIQLRLARYF